MGTTVPGGRYVTSDGRLVDANGQPLAAAEPAEAPTSEPAPALPEGFPHAGLLTEAGFGTLQLVTEATDDDLLAVKGVGKAALRDIRAAL